MTRVSAAVSSHNSRSAPFETNPFEAAAIRAAAQMIKNRARAYARRPLGLEALYPGLSHARPEKLIAIAAHLVEREGLSPRRWFGFGGEVNLINAKAAALLGRALRRQARRA